MKLHVKYIEILRLFSMLIPYSYQEKSIQRLLQVYTKGLAAVDASDAGTGKTIVAVETMKRMGSPPTLVVSPKAVIPQWQRIAAAQHAELDAVNYEMVRTGRTPYGKWGWLPGCRTPRFFWDPAIKFLILDEAHRCEAIHGSKIDDKTRQWKSASLNADMMSATRRQGIRTLALSATLAESPLQMDALGYILGLHDGHQPPAIRNPNPVTFFDWARRHGCDKGFWSDLEFMGTLEQRKAQMAKLHAQIFPEKGVRVRIKDLGSLFPESQITAELFDLGTKDEVDALYARMDAAMSQLRLRTDTYAQGDPLSEVLALRQEVELLKVPGLVDLAEDGLRNGMSVVLFVNFKLTLRELCKRLHTDCFIDGTQVGARGAIQREENRIHFQEDRERVIVCNSDAGGIGLDLQDIRGVFPRLVLATAGYNAKVLRQLLFRVRRIGAKTKSLQRILFAAGTVEERVHRRLVPKLDCLDTLQDGDLMPNNLALT